MSLIIKDGILTSCSADDGSTSLVIPEGVTGIAGDAMRICRNITEITLPESLTEIGGRAFAFCTALKSVTLPRNLKILGRHCFDRCKNLQDIFVAGDNPNFCSIDGAVYSKDGTVLVMVPAGKTELTLSPGLTKITPYIITAKHKLGVLRLYPDDIAIYREYHKVRDVEDEILKALKMIRTGKYTTQVNSVVKYPFIIQKYFREPDEVTAAYLRRCMTRIMADAIPAGDIVGISALARAGNLFTKSGIERYIKLALAENQQQIWAILAGYKSRNFGFESQNDLL